MNGILSDKPKDDDDVITSVLGTKIEEEKLNILEKLIDGNEAVVTESYHVINNHFIKLDSLFSKSILASNALESLLLINKNVSTSLENGGLNKLEYSTIVLPTLNHIDKHILNRKVTTTISTECFNNIHTRNHYTNLALESISEFISKIWDYLKEGIKYIYNALIDLFKSIYNYLFGTTEFLNKSNKAIEDLKEKFKEYEKDKLRDIVNQDKFKDYAYLDLSSNIKDIILLDLHSNNHYSIIVFDKLADAIKERRELNRKLLEHFSFTFDSICQNAINIHDFVMGKSNDYANLSLQLTSVNLALKIDELNHINGLLNKELVNKNTNEGIYHEYRAMLKYGLKYFDIKYIEIESAKSDVGLAYSSLHELINSNKAFTFSEIEDNIDTAIVAMRSYYEGLKPISFVEDEEDNYKHLLEDSKKYKILDIGKPGDGVVELYKVGTELAKDIESKSLLHAKNTIEKNSKNVTTILSDIEKTLNTVYEKHCGTVENENGDKVSNLPNEHATRAVKLSNEILSISIRNNFMYASNSLKAIVTYVGKSNADMIKLHSKLCKAYITITKEIDRQYFGS